MRRKLKIKDQYFYWLVMAIMALGTVLRILMYWQNRSLFIDEACLSSQLIERPYLELFENLQYQYAPPFFAVLLKWMTQIFGANEYALRLVPLLASLVGLILFYRLCRIIMEDRYVILPMFLFAFGMPMLQYATEVKQYSTDVLMTIGFCLMCFRWKADTWNWKKALVWASLGAVMVWFSMPSVFVLFGIGISWWYEIWRKGEWKNIGMVSGTIFVWLLSFGLYYFSIIRKDIGLEGLEDYHARFFLPLIPNSLVELNQVKEILLTFFRTAIGPTVLAIGLGVVTLFLGGYSLRGKKLHWLLVFVLPILGTMMASGFQLYSLIPRLTLFLMPSILLLMGLGLKRLMEWSPNWLQWGWAIAVIIVFVNQTGYQYFYRPFQLEELRPVLYQVQEQLEVGDQAYLHCQATHAFVFYSEYFEDAEQLKIPDIQMGGWEDRPETVELAASNRRWLIFSHLDKKEVNAYLKALGNGYEIKEQFAARNAWGILLVKDRRME